MSNSPQRPSPGLNGITMAVMAAALFGASTPFAKVLVGTISPLLLAGLLYLGSGIGLGAWVLLGKQGREAKLNRADWPWLGGAVLFGGILGPFLLMLGLASTPASAGSLLLNLEGVLTAALAWFVFKENFDKRIAIGMGLIIGGGVLLSWSSKEGLAFPIGSLAIAGACLCWGIDNNLTQKVSHSDPRQVAAIKGAVAGVVNVSLSFALGAVVPCPVALGGALVVGFMGYGLSLVLFVLALRHIGTARTGAYFSLAPFVGALISLVILREPVGQTFWIAAGLMGLGVWLHVTEQHQHEHIHEDLDHSHRHSHDEHHDHEHDCDDASAETHSHAHTHTGVAHSHSHYPDLHHRHEHV